LHAAAEKRGQRKEPDIMEAILGSVMADRSDETELQNFYAGC